MARVMLTSMSISYEPVGPQSPAFPPPEHIPSAVALNLITMRISFVHNDHYDQLGFYLSCHFNLHVVCKMLFIRLLRHFI